MPLHDLGKSPIAAADMLVIKDLMNNLEASFIGKVTDLSPDDRQRYGSIGEQNKLLVNKVNDYRQSQPQHGAPEVNWVGFDADYQSRVFWESIIMRLSSLVRQAESTKILHDYDNYQDALADYAYAQYRADRNIPGAQDKVTELKQFFSRTGSAAAKKDATGAVDATPGV